MRYCIGCLVGFIASRMLYDVSHREHFPELGRYALGIITIAVGMAVMGRSQEDVDAFLLEAGSVGIGVALNRVL